MEIYGRVENSSGKWLEGGRCYIEYIGQVEGLQDIVEKPTGEFGSDYWSAFMNTVGMYYGMKILKVNVSMFGFMYKNVFCLELIVVKLK